MYFRYLFLFTYTFLVLMILSCNTKMKSKVQTIENKTLELVFIETENSQINDGKDLQFPESPFCPQTEIIFKTEKSGRVNLKIYDDKGSFIIEKNFNIKSPGTQKVLLKNSNVLKSGVYIYQLFLNENMFEQKKMLLLK